MLGNDTLTPPPLWNAAALGSPLERKNYVNWKCSRRPWRHCRLRWLAERPVVARVRWREDVLSTSSSHASYTHLEKVSLSRSFSIPLSCLFCFVWTQGTAQYRTKTSFFLVHNCCELDSKINFHSHETIFVVGAENFFKNWSCWNRPSTDSSSGGNSAPRDYYVTEEAEQSETGEK